MLGVWHAVRVVWKECITGSFLWAECTANITHNECSVTERTGLEHLLDSFMTDQYIGNVASTGFLHYKTTIFGRIRATKSRATACFMKDATFSAAKKSPI